MARMEHHHPVKTQRNRGPGVPGGNGEHRSVRSANLARLGQQLDVDLLAAALLMREASIRAFIQGREPVRDEYAHQITIRLAEAGFPPAWLNSADAPISKKDLNALRNLAAFANEKSPVRRDNLRVLAKAFQDRLGLLADALEITENSLSGIVEGAVKFDEQRMGHVNPRLMAAGFPNGWLEQPNAELQPDWVEALEGMATDTYESALELEHAREQAATPAVAATPLSEPLNIPEETIVAKKPVITTKPASKLAPKQAVAPAPVAPVTPEVKKAAGLPRGVMAAGRPAAPTAAKSASKPAARPASPAGAPGRAAPAEGISREQSIARAAAVNTLLETARRGAKACLWRDLLGKSLAYSGNVKNGAILVRDEMALAITKALKLPEGWLDHPMYPPATLAAWVTDATLPLPASMEEAVAQAVVTPASSPKKVITPASTPAPATLSAVKARALASAGRATGLGSQPAQPVQAKPVAPAKPAVPTPTVAVPVAALPVVPGQQPAAAMPTLPTLGSVEAGFTWQPCQDPVPLVVPGPLTQVLTDQLNKMALAGTFTEQDALRLLYFMMIPR